MVPALANIRRSNASIMAFCLTACNDGTKDLLLAENTVEIIILNLGPKKQNSPLVFSFKQMGILQFGSSSEK